METTRGNDGQELGSEPADRSAGEVPATMRAVQRARYGGAEVLEVTEVEVPPVESGTVLVEVEAASVNPLDWHRMTGTPWLVRIGDGLRRPGSPGLGADLAGTVVAVGPDVAGLRPGDEVVGMGDGTFAQYVRVPADRVVPKPSAVGFDEAAGMGVAALTALQGLRDKAEVTAGQTVLINGAAGGVGTAAVQLARWLGAEVTGVCSTRNVELVRSLGAARVIDYTAEDLATIPERFDVMFDNQGNHSPATCRRLLSDDGTYLAVGGPKHNRVLGPMGRMLSAAIRFRFASQRARMFIAQANRPDLETLAGLLGSGELRTVVDTVYPMGRIREAIDHLATG
ncbi:MAG: NAD(P)-dependent alcohol dehydrogenase, partial [Actinomycetota bacterium]